MFIRSWLLSLMLLMSSASLAKDAEMKALTFDKASTTKKYSTGLKLNKGWAKKVTFKEVKIQAALPRHFDWREQAKLTPIKNQGNCGSCYAFSTVATFQDVMATKGLGQIALSEQYLLSCNTQGFSCNGGFFLHDMHMALPFGGVPESEFPYVARQVACKTNLSHPYHLTSWAYIPSKDENTVPSIDSIKSAIYTYGPISVGVGANNAFMDYSSGVFNQCDGTQPNHAVNLVGWDDDGQYWIMRNSWSQQWGQSGFMYIKYGCNQIGIAANYVVFTSSNPNPPPVPTPTPSPTPTPTPPNCTPAPYADAGRNVRIFRNQAVRIGTPTRPNTSYHWESSVSGQFPETAQIIVRPRTTRTYTVFATTKCGTAKATAKVTIR